MNSTPKPLTIKFRVKDGGVVVGIKSVIKSVINYLLFFSVIFFPLYYFSAEPFVEADVGWHIKAGHLIRELGAIPEKDSWAFTADHKWINLSWGWGVICSYITDFIPVQYLKIVNAFLYSSLLMFGLKTLDSFGNMRAEAKFLSVIFAALVLHDWMHFRPQIISFFLLLMIYQLLNQSKTNASIDKIFAILAIIIIWANLHGMVVIAFPLIGAYVIEAMIEKRYSWLLFLISTLITSCLALLINPYNYEIFSGILLTLDSIATEFIIEWDSFKFLENTTTSIFLCLFVIIANVTNPRVPLAVKICTYLWCIASLYTQRNFPLFALIALPYMALCIDDLITNIPQFKIKTPVKILTSVIVYIFCDYYGSVYDAKYFSAKIPYKEIIYVKENFPGRNFFNEYDIGGYIIYYGNGEFKHFIDGRAGTVFSEDVLNDYRTIVTSVTPYKSVLDKYDIYGAILPYYLSNRADFMYNFRDWKQVYSGNYGVVLINTKKRHRF